MNVSKQIDPAFNKSLYEQYQSIMNAPVTTIEQFKVLDSVSVVIPLLVGRGAYATFYGFVDITAKVLLVEAHRLLYLVDSIAWHALDDNIAKFKEQKFREYDRVYWFDFRTTREKITRKDK